jgi:hypothetical protein
MTRDISKLDLQELMGNEESCIQFLFEERLLKTKTVVSATNQCPSKNAVIEHTRICNVHKKL